MIRLNEFFGKEKPRVPTDRVFKPEEAADLFGKPVDIDKVEDYNLQAHLEKLKVWRNGLKEVLLKYDSEIKEIGAAMRSVPETQMELRNSFIARMTKLDSEITRIANEIADINEEITKVVTDIHEARQELFAGIDGSSIDTNLH